MQQAKIEIAFSTFEAALKVEDGRNALGLTWQATPSAQQAPRHVKTIPALNF